MADSGMNAPPATPIVLSGSRCCGAARGCTGIGWGCMGCCMHGCMGCSKGVSVGLVTATGTACRGIKDVGTATGVIERGVEGAVPSSADESLGAGLRNCRWQAQLRGWKWGLSWSRG